MSHAIELAKRANAVRPGLRKKMFAAAAELPDLIALGRGDPDYATPPHIIAAAKKALDDGFTHYTAFPGLLPLREAIAEKLQTEDGITVDPRLEIVVTSGAQEAVFIALQVLLDPGDEVLMPDPHYTAYDGAIDLVGAKVVAVPTHEEDGFNVRPEEIEKLITPRSKILVVVNPGNPTGNVLSREQMLELAALAKNHSLTVICDDMYQKYIYDDGVEHVSMASLPGMRERTITINGFSKTYAMTGWRLGYVAAPGHVAEVMGELNYVISICAPAATQMAGIAALKGPQDQTAEMVGAYRERRDVMLEELDRMGLGYGRPVGGFTVLANVKGLGASSEDFCLRVLRDTNVQIFPGSMYGPYGEGYVRISLLAPIPRLRDGLRRIASVVEKLRSTPSRS